MKRNCFSGNPLAEEEALIACVFFAKEDKFPEITTPAGSRSSQVYDFLRLFVTRPAEYKKNQGRPGNPDTPEAY